MAEEEAGKLYGNTAPSQSGNGPQGPPQIIAGKKIYKIRGVTFEVDTNYEVIKAIGFGAYGLVCSAKDLETKEYVAIKKIPKIFDDLVDGKRVLREMKLLRMLRHPQIVKLHRFLVPREGYENFRDVYLVSELLDTDLHVVIKSKQKLQDDHQRYFMYQLLKCLLYVHTAGVIHRDLKPGNLLMNSNCDLKLCDFGLARGGIPFNAPGRQPTSTTNSPQPAGFHLPSPSQTGVTQEHVAASLRRCSLPNVMKGAPAPEQSTMVSSADPSTDAPPPATNTVKPDEDLDGAYELTEYVITRWYRPPELLLMSRYNHAVDLWSAGCILAEMILRKPLFPGKDYLGQLKLICKLIPLPESDREIETFVDSKEGRRYLKEMRDQLKERNKIQPFDPLKALQATLPKASGDALDLLQKLLVFNPNRRVTAKEAMRHPFFTQIYTPADEVEYASPTQSYLNPNQWEFDHRELQEADLRELFWREIQHYKREPPTEQHTSTI
jgi:serine/threonine protein kinase